MKAARITGKTLRVIYRRLFAHFGPQHWWPGKTRFEVAVGAILTQGTNWANASKAIAQLKENHLLDSHRLAQIPLPRLARWIRSSGYFRQKAKRLKAFVEYLHQRYGGDISRMRRVHTASLRRELLNLHGIGPETADSILLYALEKPAFVVDAYTRRILARHSFIPWETPYEQIQALFTRHLPARTRLFNEFHALLVGLGKELCLTHPKCHLCPIRNLGKLRLETTPAYPATSAV